MPKIFSPLSFSTLSNIPSVGRGTHALAQLQFTFDGPPDMRNYSRVISVSAKSLRHFLIAKDIQDAEIWKDLAALEALDAQIQARPHRPQYIQICGAKFMQWGYVGELPANPADDVLIAIGAEFVVATILKRQFRSRVIKDLKGAAHASDPSRELKKISTRITLEAIRLIEASKSQSNTEIQTYVRIKAALSSQLHPMRLVERQDAGTTSQLSDEEALHAAKILKTNAESGCVESLQVIIAFCIGVVWDIALDVPFSHIADDDWIAQLEISSGITRVDLKEVLPVQAKAQIGHAPSAPVVVRPVPAFAHGILVALCSKHPHVTCLRALNQTQLKSHHPLPGISRELADRITIARFIASRGRIAKLAGIDAATAAYSVCDLTKIGKAKHSYITFTQQEIWDAVETVYSYLKWGKPVPLDSQNGVGIGSCVTPTQETVKAVDAHLLNRYKSSKAGKKYTLASLINHHNTYAIFCAHRVSFLESGRLADEYNLLASDYRSGAVFGRLNDKSANDFMGKTPIPLPVTVTEQIALWLVNLKLFDGRLAKLGMSPDSPIRLRIHKVLAGEPVPLFFQIIDNLPVNIGSSDIRSALPPELQIKMDDGRHYMPNAARRLGVPSPYVDGMVRHHTAGTALSSGMANVTQIEWLATAADSIDRIAIELGFFAVVGLGQ